MLFPVPSQLFVFSYQEPLQLMSVLVFILWLLLYNSTSDSVPFLEMRLKVLTLIMRLVLATSFPSFEIFRRHLINVKIGLKGLLQMIKDDPFRFITSITNTHTNTRDLQAVYLELLSGPKHTFF